MSINKDVQNIRNNILNDQYYLNYLTDTDLTVINNNIEKLAKKENIESLPISKSLKTHVAKRIKFFSTKCSCRRLAEICFDKSDNRHGIQMDGRDLKRWAAIELNELFDDNFLFKNEYWHEY